MRPETLCRATAANTGQLSSERLLWFRLTMIAMIEAIDTLEKTGKMGSSLLTADLNNELTAVPMMTGSNTSSRMLFIMPKAGTDKVWFKYK